MAVMAVVVRDSGRHGGVTSSVAVWWWGETESRVSAAPRKSEIFPQSKHIVMEADR